MVELLRDGHKFFVYDFRFGSGGAVTVALTDLGESEDGTFHRVSYGFSICSPSEKEFDPEHAHECATGRAAKRACIGRWERPEGPDPEGLIMMRPDGSMLVAACVQAGMALRDMWESHHRNNTTKAFGWREEAYYSALGQLNSIFDAVRYEGMEPSAVPKEG